MNHADIALLMRGAAPAIRDFVDAAVRPLIDRIDVLEEELRSARAVDHSADIARSVAEAMAAVALPKDGKDGAPGRDGLDGAAGKDGLDGKDGEPGADGAPGKDGADGLPGKDGADGTPGIAGADGKDGLPGKDGEPGERGADGVNGRDGVDGIAGTDGKDGLDGVAGRDGLNGTMPIVRAWADEVHHAGDVVTHDGATWQAVKDTGKAPPHEDWACLAQAGRDGAPGRSFAIRGTFGVGNQYSMLDVVALNGASFIAKMDEPGNCPGPGWQLVAAQGKRGERGEGMKGDSGTRGLPGQPVVAADIDEQGLLTLTNGDGSTVTCDLYPLLAKIG